MVPVLQIFDNNMPEYTQEVRASENNNYKLNHSVKLHDQKSPQNWVWDVEVVVADVVLQLVVVVLVYYLLELLHVQQLSQTRETEHLQETEETNTVLVNASSSLVQNHVFNRETSSQIEDEGLLRIMFGNFLDV